MNFKVQRNRLFFVIILSIGFTLAMYLVLNFSLSQPNSAFIKLLPEEAYIIILHDIFNQSLEKLSTITFEDLEGKFTSQYIMLRGDGKVYQANENSHDIVTEIDITEPPVTGGIHFGWEITTNNTKYYIDSTSGQIVSSKNISVQE